MRRVGRSCPVKDRTASVPIISPLGSQADNAIEALLDTAFGPDRHGRTAYKIRNGVRWIDDFSYAALSDAGDFLGLLQSWPVALQDESRNVDIPLIMVGPVAVIPDHQGTGIGRALMNRLINDADKYSDSPLMMIGDPEYYGRFWGFSADITEGWKAPGPVDAHRLLARDVPGGVPLQAGLSAMLVPRRFPAPEFPITAQSEPATSPG